MSGGEELLALAERVVAQALPGEQVEAFVSRDWETDIRVYEGEVEHFVSAQSEGIGIAPDMRDRLFEAFDQADYSPTRAYEGSGVSLAVVQRFARLLGGRVDVESVPGEGSTFTLRLPEGPARAIPERSGELAAASQ